MTLVVALSAFYFFARKMHHYEGRQAQFFFIIASQFVVFYSSLYTLRCLSLSITKANLD